MSIVDISTYNYSFSDCNREISLEVSRYTSSNAISTVTIDIEHTNGRKDMYMFEREKFSPLKKEKLSLVHEYHEGLMSEKRALSYMHHNLDMFTENGPGELEKSPHRKQKEKMTPYDNNIHMGRLFIESITVKGEKNNDAYDALFTSTPHLNSPHGYGKGAELLINPTIINTQGNSMPLPEKWSDLFSDLEKVNELAFNLQFWIEKGYGYDYNTAIRSYKSFRYTSSDNDQGTYSEMIDYKHQREMPRKDEQINQLQDVIECDGLETFSIPDIIAKSRDAAPVNS